MNKGKQLIIASAILAVLIVITLQLGRDPFEKSHDQDYSKLLPNRADGSIDKIVVKNKESNITVEKRADAWWITEPRELASDEQGLKAAAAFLEKMVIADIASKKKERQSEYGFKDNPDLVEVKAFSKATELLDFKAGKVTVDFKGSFVLLPSDPDTVYSTSEPLPPIFTRGVKDWRNKYIWDVPKEDVERVQLVSSQGALDLDKDAQGNWSKKDDPQWKIDANRLDQLITTLSKLAWAEVVDDPDPAVDYGFVKPQAKISMTAKGKEYVLNIGKELDQPKGSTWIQAESDPRVYQVRKPQAEKLTRDWSFYREDNPEAAPDEKPKTPPEIKPEGKGELKPGSAKTDSKQKKDTKPAQSEKKK